MLERFSQTDMTSNAAEGIADSAAVDITTDELVERVVVWAQGMFGSEEVVRAKEDFFVLFGKVFHEDAFFEARMNYFLEYFVFLRPISQFVASEHVGQTPFAAYKVMNQEVGSEVAANRTAIHSLFQIAKHRSDHMIVKDLITGLKHKLVPKGAESLCGFGKNDIFQGFVFTSGDQSFVSLGVVIHPRRAEGVIRKIIKTAKKNLSITGDELLQKLAHLQVRAARHGHVNPKLIYSAPTR